MRELMNAMSGKIGTALLTLAVKPNTAANQERLGRGLDALVAEDPTISVNPGQATGEVVIGGMGELHLEIVIDRLKREFAVEASVGRPTVAYKEMLTRPADGQAKYAEPMAGRAQYAHAKIHLYPGEPGSGYVFENAIGSGAIPAKFVKPVDEGIAQALTCGVLAGYPVVDVHAVLYDGSYHDVDSSEMAFTIAGSLAFCDAARKAKPVLLEPVMHVEVTVPNEDAGDVIGNLSSRRGQVLSRQDRDAVQIIQARVPLSRMFGYATDLRSRTRGRGTFAMRFALYQPCDPPENKDEGNGPMVRVPLRPTPALPDSSVALPEPIGDDLQDG